MQEVNLKTSDTAFYPGVTVSASEQGLSWLRCKFELHRRRQMAHKGQVLSSFPCMYIVS